MRYQKTVLVLGAALVLSVSVPTAASGDVAPSEVATRLQKALDFRMTFGLRTDRAFVRTVEADARFAEARHRFSVALTNSEVREMERRELVAAQLNDVERQLTRRYPKGFAGLYTDQAAGGVVCVGVVAGRRISLAGIRNQFPPGTRMRRYRAEFTLAQISHAQRRITRRLAASPELKRLLVAIYPGVERNRIVLAVRRGIARRTWYRLAHRRSLLQVRLVDSSREHARQASQIDSISQAPGVSKPVDTPDLPPYPPTWGGVPVRTGEPTTFGLGCTSGFNAVDVSAPSNHYILMNNTCGSGGQRVHYQSHEIGTIAKTVSSSTALANAAQISAADANALIFLGDADPLGSNGPLAPNPLFSPYRSISVTQVQPFGVDHVGDPVCQAGAGTGFACGVIEKLDVTSYDSATGQFQTGRRIASIRSLVGDLGAPVFFDQVAMGMNEAIYVDTGDFVKIVQDGDASDAVQIVNDANHASKGMVYIPIEHQLSGLNMQLYGGAAADLSEANRYRPLLYFDSSERYRPVRLNALFQEFPTPPHQVCRPAQLGTQCAQVLSPTELRASPYNDSSAYLDVSGRGDDPESYRTTQPGCVGALLDCDAGAASALYYHSVVGRGDQRFLDYWSFYRFNDYTRSVGLDQHEGDWESASVAVGAGSIGPFSYAIMSQHGVAFKYLPGVLRCDGGGDGSCGSAEAPSGYRVELFVSNGNHANYPHPCSAPFNGLGCDITIGAPVPAPGAEKGHDGAKEWGNDYAAASVALEPFPLAANSWTYWEGRWGAESDGLKKGPQSPGNQAYFNDPDNNKCGSSSCRSSTPVGDGCEDWAGAMVAVAACSAARPAPRPGERAGVQVEVIGPQPYAKLSDGSSEITQVLGRPLIAGESLRLTSGQSRSVELLARVLIAKEPKLVRIDRHLPGGEAAVTVTHEDLVSALRR